HRYAAVAAVTGAQVQGHVVHEGCHGRDPFLIRRELRLKHVRASRSSPQRLRVRLCKEAVALGGSCNDVDDLAATLRAELDSTGREGEQRVVATTADVDARVEVGSALADEDLARADDLAAEALHAKALRVGVATVTCGRCALFVCHC